MSCLLHGRVLLFVFKHLGIFKSFLCSIQLWFVRNQMFGSPTKFICGSPNPQYGGWYLVMEALEGNFPKVLRVGPSQLKWYPSKRSLSLPLSSPPPAPEQAYTQERPCTGAPGKKVAICKPGRHSSPEPNYSGTLTLDLQPPELWEKFLLSYPVCVFCYGNSSWLTEISDQTLYALNPFSETFFHVPKYIISW